jgi:hypothetical protein
MPLGCAWNTASGRSRSARNSASYDASSHALNDAARRLSQLRARDPESPYRDCLARMAAAMALSEPE